MHGPAHTDTSLQEEETRLPISLGCRRPCLCSSGAACRLPLLQYMQPVTCIHRGTNECATRMSFSWDYTKAAGTQQEKDGLLSHSEWGKGQPLVPIQREQSFVVLVPLTKAEKLAAVPSATQLTLPVPTASFSRGHILEPHHYSIAVLSHST